MGWVCVLFLPVCAHGWSYGGRPWTQVADTSIWKDNYYFQDGGNPINLINQFTATADSLSLKTTYVDQVPNLNYTAITVDAYFDLDTDACFSADLDWITLPHKQYQVDPPYVDVWCSVMPLDAPDYPFIVQSGYRGAPHMQIHMAPRFCAGYTGVIRLSFANGLNPRDGYYGFGSGSSFRISNLQILAGKCTDRHQELVASLSVMGAFLATFVGLCVGLKLLQRKFPQGKPFVALSAWWHLFKVASQCVFAWSMYQRNFSVSYALIVCFLVMPLSIQTVSACLLMATELRRSEFSVWYYRHRIVCNTLGTLIPVLGMHTMALLHCKVRGWSGFSAPFSANAVASIKFSMLLAALMQDLPLFILSLVMQTQLREANPVIALAIATSLGALLYRIGAWARYSYSNLAMGQAGLTKRVGGTWGDWTELWDQESGRWYYENKRTHATSWDKPEGFTGAPEEVTKPASCRQAFSRKRVLFSLLAAVAFFGLGMAARFHVQVSPDQLAQN